MTEVSYNAEANVSVIFGIAEEVSSEKPQISEWSSLVSIQLEADDDNKPLFKQGLYSPGRADICTKYIAQSDSTITRHPYYNYLAITDPGIREALLLPEQPVVYSDDGQDLYLHLCSEMNLCPVRMFYKKLLNSEISLSYYGVDPRGVRAMAMALQFNNHVHIFDLTDNFLTDDSCFHLGQMLQTNTTLRELNLTGCRIGTSGLINLGNHLARNQTLETLNLARNDIGDEGGAYFAKLISGGATVKNVNLSKNDLGQKTAIALMEALEWRESFKILDLSKNSFHHIPSTVKMIFALGNSQILEEINLSFNAFEEERVASAIHNILQIPTLKVLDLSHNRLQGRAIEIIIPGLIHANKLVTLNLSFNPMSPEDAYHTLEKMLRPKVKLQNLLMDSVPVNKSFLTLVTRVSTMKSRRNFKVVYGEVLRNWDVEGPDIRTLLLKRIEYLGSVKKRKYKDIMKYFFKIEQKNSASILPRDLLNRMSEDGISLSGDIVDELAQVFPGPIIGKFPSINLNSLCEYIRRLWPDKKASRPKPVAEQMLEVAKPQADKKNKKKTKN